MSDMEFEEAVVMGDANTSAKIRSPLLSKTRSLSDGGGTPKLSPSPHIFEAARRHSKDDTAIRDRTRDRDRELEREREAAPSAPPLPLPSTPVRTGFQPLRSNLSLQLPPRDGTSPAHQSAYVKQPVPLSPKLDHSQIYASPTGTNILPRRSRGLDFSRAATSLHHSTLADPASPDSSPTIGSRAMNIPGRRPGDFGTAEQSSNSLWSVMGGQERHSMMNISSSLGSNAATHLACSSGSSSSDDDDLMDEDMDESFLTTPQAHKMGNPATGSSSGVPWMTSPAVNSLMSFQQRQRPRKQPKKRLRAPGPLGLGLGGGQPQPILSKSPPSHASAPKDISGFHHGRRESISWAANQLHISGSESDDNHKSHGDNLESPSRPGVIRRAVTRRGNLLPKTKGFARIRAALMEESAPVESEVAREAEVIRQVLESDMDLEPRVPPSHSAATTALSSPNLNTQDNPDDLLDDAMMMDTVGGPLGPPASFKQQAIKNSKGKIFWDNLSDNGNGMPPRITPPPPTFARGSSSVISTDDLPMDSPSLSASSQNPFANLIPQTTTSSSGPDTPQPMLPREGSQGSGSGSIPNAGFPSLPGAPPSAAEITRRINSKRRRDDDFDPISFKRRAVSPGMSVHNSPIMQSPMQRDPWGSRPGSVGGDTVGKTVSGSSAPSENGSGGAGTPGAAAGGSQGNGGRINAKGRVGFQGMVDTNDGITKLSIE
ncbi:hypothetical protein GQ53DRAFT_751853 [Thozetella sp. PMI_491]|nr:hypothetical protein GQ53DRAFT_751853 [Thozetella sp. PMI_491]